MSTLSTMTYREFESLVRAESGAKDHANPNRTTIMRWTNIALKKIARLTLGIDAPWGRSTGTVSLAQALGGVHDPGDGGSFTASTLTFAGMPFIVTAAWEGGWVFWRDGANSRGWWGLIEDFVSSSSFTVRVTGGSGAIANVTDANLLAIAKPNPVFYNGGTLTSLNYMDVLKVVDATTGLVTRLTDDEFASFADNSNYDSSIVMQMAGNAVYLGKGVNVTSFDTLTATFEERPDTISVATQTLDILPEHIAILKDEVVRWVLNYMGSEKVKTAAYPLAELEERFKKIALQRVHRAQKHDTVVRN